MDEIDGFGGMVEASNAGWLRRLMDQRQWELQQSIESGQRPIVGVNCHQIPPEEDTLLSYRGEHPSPCQEQVEIVREFRRKRNSTKVRTALQSLRSQAEIESENLIIPIKQTVEAGATLGEVLGTIRQAYGLSYDPVGAISADATL
jgi:methylmalonyl-CoA mutase N-terminal domain/subunit